MLGMYINYRVEVPNAPLESEALAKSKGVQSESRAEGAEPGDAISKDNALAN